MPNCAVPGCRSKQGITFHNFPKETERCIQWLNSVKRYDLLGIPLQKNYRICTLHFDNNYKVINGKRTILKNNATPSLCLPEEGIVVETIVDSISSLKKRRVLLDVESPQPSTSTNQEFDHQHIEENVISELSIEEGTPPLSNIKQKLIKMKRMKNGRRSRYSRGLITIKTATYRGFKERIKFLEGQIKELSQYDIRNEGNVNQFTKDFFVSQVSQQGKSKSPHGRRYTTEEKAIGLSMLKQGKKAYRFLREENKFALPSETTLKVLTSKIPFKSGFNKKLLNSLKMTVQGMTEEFSKYCVLAFDEVKLEPGLSFDVRSQEFVGFQDCGNGRVQDLADHAIAFMAIGIKQRWKQPIAYYFVKNMMSAPDLARNVKEIIRCIQGIGLTVVATVSDQGAANSRAIRLLREETKMEVLRDGGEYNGVYFIVDGQEIVPLFDPPHLLKCVRNNLLTKNIYFTYEGKDYEGSWNDIILLNDAEDGTNACMLPRVTRDCFDKTVIKKMKVSCAAKVFSNTLSAALFAYSSFDDVPQSRTVRGTAVFCYFMDTLFDSVNGNEKEAPYSKKFRCALSASSPHLDFWRKAKAVLHTVRYKGENVNKFDVPPCIKNWIGTLDGLEYLWKRLSNEGLPFMPLRRLNQDPVENLFGQIRSHLGPNRYPSCQMFATSIKSIIFSKMSNSSFGTNCEEDRLPMLDIMNTLLMADEPDEVAPHSELDNEEMVEEAGLLLESEYNQAGVLVSNMTKNTSAYIGGYFVNKFLEKVDIKSCQICFSDLVLPASTCSDSYTFISLKEYKPGALHRPSNRLIELYTKCSNILHTFLPNIAHESTILERLMSILHENCISDFKCSEHDMLTLFIKKYAMFHVYMWMRNVNRILNGKMKLPANDIIKKKAAEMHAKKRKHK